VSDGSVSLAGAGTRPRALTTRGRRPRPLRRAAFAFRSASPMRALRVDLPFTTLASIIRSPKATPRRRALLSLYEPRQTNIPGLKGFCCVDYDARPGLWSQRTHHQDGDTNGAAQWFPASAVGSCPSDPIGEHRVRFATRQDSSLRRSARTSRFRDVLPKKWPRVASAPEMSITRKPA